MSKQKPTDASGIPVAEKSLFTLEVFLLSGPITEEFVNANPVVSRTIQIRGDQTLEDLHHAIFEAFDREEEHMYEFQFGGKRPNDPKARQYVLPPMMEDDFSEREYAGDLTETRIGSLGLKKNDVFGYWFDYGDDWWHQVDVVEVDEIAPAGRYPKIIARTGESPPQYADFDDEEMDEDEDEEYDEEEYEEEYEEDDDDEDADEDDES